MPNQGNVEVGISVDASKASSGISKVERKFSDAVGGMKTSAVALGNIVANVGERAVSAITGSIGSAAARVDTFNAFKNVMTSLGESSEDANSAISKVKSTLSGLPSTSQNIVSLLQQVKATGMSLGEATDATLAMNNAMLAGGKGADYAESAVTSYAKALSKGKFDMQQWLTLVQTAPAQVDQLAKSIMGAEGNQQKLYEAIKDGDISMESFTNALIRLNSEGAEGMKSFDEQARAATGGIMTSVANVRNRIVNAVSSVVEAIDGVNGEQRISKTLDAISGDFGKMGSEAAAAVTEMLPKIQEAVNLVLENKEAITQALKSVLAGFVAYKAVHGIVEGAIKPLVSFGKSTKDAAKDAVDAAKGIKVFNTGMSLARLGAIGLGAAVAALAVAGIAALIQKCVRYNQVGTTLTKSLSSQKRSALAATKSMSELARSTESTARSYYDAAKAVDEMIERQDALAKSIKDRNTDLETGVLELEGYRSSIERLNGTADESSLPELEAAVSALNDRLGTAYTVAGDAADGYYIMADGARAATDDILGLIDAQELQMRLDATRETRRALMEEEYRAAEDLASAQADLAEQQQLVNDAYEYAASSDTPWYLKAGAYEAYQAVADEVGAYEEKVSKLEAAHADAAGAAEKVAEQENFIAHAMGENATAMDVFVAKSSTVQAALSQSGGSLSDFAGSLDELGLSTQDLAQLTDSELALVAASYDGTAESVLVTLKGLADSTPQSGANAIEGLIEGMDSMSGPLYARAAQIVENAIARMKEAAGEHSPWKTTIAMGKHGAEGLAIGLEKGASDAVAAAEKLVSGVLSAAQIDDALSNIHWDSAVPGYSMVAAAAAPPASAAPMGMYPSQQDAKAAPTIIIQELNVQADDAEGLYLDVMRRLQALEAM